jgi:hypothetical protein
MKYWTIHSRYRSRFYFPLFKLYGCRKAKLTWLKMISIKECSLHGMLLVFASSQVLTAIRIQQCPVNEAVHGLN